MMSTFGLILMGAIILMIPRIPAFLGNASFSKRDKIAVMIFVVLLFALGIVASDAYGIIMSLLGP